LAKGPDIRYLLLVCFNYILRTFPAAESWLPALVVRTPR